jgi:flavin-binding protein dodecin
MPKDIGKIVQFVSTSDKSFDDAVRKAVKEITRKEKGVRGIDVKRMTARIDNGKILEYRVTINVSSEY